MIRSIQIALLGIRKWLYSPRMYVVFMMLAVFEWTLIQDIRGYAVSIGLAVSCWYFPFLFAANINCMFYYFALILMFCNAPYVDGHQLYVILRCGRTKWFVGQILYTVFASLLFFAWMALLSVLEFVPYVGFSNKWESVLTNISINPHYGIYYLNVPRQILEAYTPVQAFGLSFGINVCVGILLGLLIFYVNLWKSRGYGAAVAMVVIAVSDMMNLGAMGIYRWMLKLSPVSWGNLLQYCQGYTSLSLGYVWSVLIGGIVLLIVLIMIRSRKFSIEALEEI